MAHFGWSVVLLIISTGLYMVCIYTCKLYKVILNVILSVCWLDHDCVCSRSNLFTTALQWSYPWRKFVHEVMNFHGLFMNVHEIAWMAHALFVKNFAGCSWTVHKAPHELFMKFWWIKIEFMNFVFINILIHECSWMFISIISWTNYSWKFH